MSEVDLCGLKCPMPVLRVKKALQKAQSEETLSFLTDDPHAPEDLRVFARQSGHTIVSQEDLGDGRVRNVLRRRQAA